MGTENRFFSIPALALLAGVVGCSAPDGSLPEDVGSSAEAVLDTTQDRPPAAAGIGVVVGGTRQLWIFACGDSSRNVLQIKTRESSSSQWWSEWTDITDEPDYAACAGTPAVGGWSGWPNDEVEVVYRGLNNELHEYYVDPAGNKHFLNLSRYLNIGPINGDPVIADMREGRLSVVVRLAGNKLTSLDIYSNAWHTRPVLTDTGAQAIATGPIVGHFDDASFGFISSQNSTKHRVYTRTSWTTNFKQIKEPIVFPPGLLTFAHIAGQSQCAAPYPCVLSRNSSQQPTIAATTGSTWSFTALPMNSSKYTQWGDGARTGYSGAGSIISENLDAPDRGLFWFWVLSTVDDQGFGYGVGPDETLISAPNLVVNPGLEYGGWAVNNVSGNVNVFHFNRADRQGWLENLGLNLSTL